MKEYIIKSIRDISELEIASINKETDNLVNNLTDSILNEAKNNASLALIKAKEELENKYTEKKFSYELLERQYINKIKRDVLDNLRDSTIKRLSDFTGSNLCNIVASLIKKEGVNESKIICVNKDDYKKYLNALSSSKSDKLVVTDLLNSITKIEFKLSNEPINISSGFVLIGDDYDLNFDFESLVDKVIFDYEHELSEKLFT